MVNPFPEEDIVAFLQYIDLDEDGRIGFDEFKLLFRCSEDSESLCMKI